MNKVVEIKDSIFWVGVNDRTTAYFEGLWPLPRGVAYNAYCIVDQKIALVDTVKGAYQMLYLEKIRDIIGEKKVDYLIINHMEPDHSGAVKMITSIYPEIQIIGNKKTKEFVEGFYGIHTNFKVIEDEEELQLGSRTLKFYITPMVHWPETMMTFDARSGVLFSGDAFGGFGTLDGGIFDDEVDVDFYVDETLRYFSNIVAKYSPMVLKAIDKLSAVNISVIAATHGPIYRKNPATIINYYLRWSRQETEKGVIVAYGSMYGNTERMAEMIARSLAENGIERVILHDLSKAHISHVIKNIWRYKGLVLGSCTYNMKVFPPPVILPGGSSALVIGLSCALNGKSARTASTPI